MEKGGGHGQAEGRHGQQGERGSYTQGQQSPEGGELIKNAIFSSVEDPDWTFPVRLKLILNPDGSETVWPRRIRNVIRYYRPF